MVQRARAAITEAQKDDFYATAAEHARLALLHQSAKQQK
jgi:hypothetical protein